MDWDGAIASGREVARFGAELWERLNGKEKEEGLPSLAEIFGQVIFYQRGVDDYLACTENLSKVLTHTHTSRRR